MAHIIAPQPEPHNAVAGMIPALCSAIVIAALIAAIALEIGLSLIWGLVAYSGTGAMVLVIAGLLIGRHCPYCTGRPYSV